MSHLCRAATRVSALLVSTESSSNGLICSQMSTRSLHWLRTSKASVLTTGRRTRTNFLAIEDPLPGPITFKLRRKWKLGAAGSSLNCTMHEIVHVYLILKFSPKPYSRHRLLGVCSQTSGCEGGNRGKPRGEG